jgi:ferredoxin
MDAVDIVDAVAVFDDNRCIGCGLCVTGCPNQALTLERRREVPVPPETRAEMAVRILTSRDKLDDFMKLMNR